MCKDKNSCVASMFASILGTRKVVSVVILMCLVMLIVIQIYMYFYSDRYEVVVCKYNVLPFISLYLITLSYLETRFWGIRKFVFDFHREGNTLKFQLVDICLTSHSLKVFCFEEISIPVDKLLAIHKIRFHGEETSCYEIKVDSDKCEYLFVCGEQKSKIDSSLGLGLLRNTVPITYILPYALDPVMYSVLCVSGWLLIAMFITRLT